MKLSITFFGLALVATAFHFWQLHQRHVLKSQIDALETEAIKTSFDGMLSEVDRQPAANAARNQAASSLKDRQAALHSRAKALAQAFSRASALAVISLPAVMLLLMLGFASIRPQRGQMGASIPRAFVSYNHQNLELAVGVRDQLTSLGCSVTLIDRLLDVSDDEQLATILREQILGASAMVVLLTPESVKSDWVGFERVLGDARLQRIIYLFDRLSFLGAVWRTHFLPQKAAGFKVIKLLKAQRRYIRLEAANSMSLVAAHVARADRQGGGLLSLKQFAYSFGSIDQMLLNMCFNACENRTLGAGATRLWKLGVGVCALLQTVFVATPFYMFLWSIDFLANIYD